MDRQNGVPVDGLALVRGRLRQRSPRLLRWAEGGVVLAALAAGLLFSGRVSDRSVAVDDSVRADEFRIVPVRVHLLRTELSTAISTKLTADDVTRIFRKVNAIWRPAGIHWWVESIVEEKPANVAGHEQDVELPLDALLPLRSSASRTDQMFHVYYVGAMVVNGIFIRRDGVFVQEAARLIPVAGGIDEPLPRVTAHELGHGLGLSHRQARTNLMASGTTGTSLNEAEMETARHVCYGLSWVERADQFLKKADALAEDGKKDEAQRRYRAILDLPGESPLKDHASERLKGDAVGRK